MFHVRRVVVVLCFLVLGCCLLFLMVVVFIELIADRVCCFVLLCTGLFL